MASPFHLILVALVMKPLTSSVKCDIDHGLKTGNYFDATSAFLDSQRTGSYDDNSSVEFQQGAFSTKLERYESLFNTPQEIESDIDREIVYRGNNDDIRAYLESRAPNNKSSVGSLLRAVLGAAKVNNYEGPSNASKKILHRVKRYKQFHLLSFKGMTRSLYKGYQYGFPKHATTFHLCPKENYMGQRFSIAHYFERKLEECIASKQRLLSCRSKSNGDFSVTCKKRVSECFWGKLMDITNDLQARHVKAPEPDKYLYAVPYSNEDLSICYYWLLCNKLGKMDVCPNPCLHNPCIDKDYTASQKCTLSGKGLHEHEFHCDCQKFKQWDINILKCVHIDVCKSKDLKINPCHIANTELCSQYGTDFSCQCKMNAMGPLCATPRNACLQNYHTSRPSGNTACGPNGRCIPINGTNSYICECFQGYLDNRNNDYKDCQRKVDVCSTILCNDANGHCRRTPDNKRAQCVCDKGYEGDSCEKLSPNWNDWNLWSPCYPECGKYRKRNRTRSCNVLDGCKSSYPFMEERCSVEICLVDGKWGEWTEYTVCSVMCGGGEQTRERECYYETEYGEKGRGKPCLGSALNTRPCNTQECADIEHVDVIDIQKVYTVEPPLIAAEDNKKSKKTSYQVVILMVALKILTVIIFCVCWRHKKRKKAEKEKQEALLAEETGCLIPEPDTMPAENEPRDSSCNNVDGGEEKNKQYDLFHSIPEHGSGHYGLNHSQYSIESINQNVTNDIPEHDNRSYASHFSHHSISGLDQSSSAKTLEYEMDKGKYRRNYSQHSVFSVGQQSSNKILEHGTQDYSRNYSQHSITGMGQQSPSKIPERDIPKYGRNDSQHSMVRTSPSRIAKHGPSKQDALNTVQGGSVMIPENNIEGCSLGQKREYSNHRDIHSDYSNNNTYFMPDPYDPNTEHQNNREMNPSSHHMPQQQWYTGRNNKTKQSKDSNQSQDLYPPYYADPAVYEDFDPLYNDMKSTDEYQT